MDETSLSFTTTTWDTAQTVTVTAAEDNDTADETVTLTHTAAGGGYAGETRTLAVTVDDDDELAQVTGVTVTAQAPGAEGGLDRGDGRHGLQGAVEVGRGDLCRTRRPTPASARSRAGPR